MKRKLIILVLAVSTSVSVFGGLASLLAAQPEVPEKAPGVESETIQMTKRKIHHPTMTAAVARKKVVPGVVEVITP